MTQEQVLQQIRQWIIQNGNNEITADVLRPILEDILNQPNTLIGDLSTLNTEAKNTLVDAINEVAGDIDVSLPIITGDSDPRITPPATYDLGVFYRWVQNGSTVGFFQYNGNQWVEISSRPPSVRNNIRVVSTAYSVNLFDYTIIYEGSTANELITIPPASSSGNRVLRIVNRSGESIRLSETFEQFFPLTNPTSDVIERNTVMLLQSDGNLWYKINNTVI